MGTAYKSKRVAVTADTDTKLHDAAASVETVVSRVTVTNIGSTDRTYRVAHVDGVIAAVANEDYVAYDETIRANKHFDVMVGTDMESAEEILVRASHADVVFKVWYTEIS